MICLNFIDRSYFPCLKTIDLMFHFALNKPERANLATNLFLGANVMEGIGIIPMIFSASWHSLLFIYQLYYLLNLMYE